MNKQVCKKGSSKVLFLRKKAVKIILFLMGILFLIVFAFIAFVYASGSRVFNNGDDAGKTFLETLSLAANSKTPLRGETEDRINILFMGIGGANHPGGQLTDSMMLVSFKPKTHALAMLSIPRDFYVQVADHKISTKLNEVYALGDKEKKGSGPSLVKKTVGNIVGLPIDYYVTVDFTAFEKFIDEIGGVDVYVDKALYDPYYPDAAMEGYEPFSIKAGQQHLDGETALKFARSRETSSDFDRASRQQKLLVAVKEKTLNLGFLANPKKTYDLIQIVGDHIRTDFSPAEVKALVGLIQKIDNNKTVSKVLTNASDGPLVSDSSSGTYYLLPRLGDYQEIQDIAQNIFSDPSAGKETASIEILNGSKSVGAAAKMISGLKSLGYAAANSGQAKGDYQKTLIYDYTKGAKTKTLNLLKNELGAEIIQKTADKNTDSDIVIIIGDDYFE